MSVKIMLIAALLLSTSAFADDHPTTAIKGLTTVITAAKNTTSLAVLVPSHIPLIKKNACGYLDSVSEQGYRITIDRDCDCHGAHYCNIGSFTAKVGANPVIHHDMQHHEVTHAVNLANGSKAYYTKGYALGSFFFT